MYNYPVYKNHAEVKCWSCGMLLIAAKSKLTEYPTGKWTKYCNICQMYIHYDLIEEEESK